MLAGTSSLPTPRRRQPVSCSLHWRKSDSLPSHCSAYFCSSSSPAHTVLLSAELKLTRRQRNGGGEGANWRTNYGRLAHSCHHQLHDARHSRPSCCCCCAICAPSLCCCQPAGGVPCTSTSTTASEHWEANDDCDGHCDTCANARSAAPRFSSC